MKLLAIETSCDETGIAIVEGSTIPSGFSFTVCGASLISQANLHAEYGGVYPNLAKREHLKNLPTILDRALEKAGLQTMDTIDAVAVTQGPGLEPALWTGITFAQALAKKWNKPLFGTNHMEGHLVSSLAQDNKIENLQFPILALLISGGHTEFILMKDWFNYERIGETLDDAVGECFDKVARMLGLTYPGGPEISRLAARARSDAELTRKYAEKFKLPRPMINSKNCDVSFSGLKTAALYALRDAEQSRPDLKTELSKVGPLDEEEKAAFAREFEDTVTEVFCAKTYRALEQTNAKSFVIGGGVAANAHIRKSLVEMLAKEFPEIEVRLPELSITGDNAIMIGEAALAHLLAGNWKLDDVQKEIRAQGNLSI